jgi:hypothetical protein
MDPFTVEAGVQEKNFPRYLVEALRADEEAMTYQFVVVARPSVAPGNGRAKTRASKEAQQLGQRLLARERELTAENERLGSEAKRLQRDLHVRTGELEGAHRRISDIEGSIGWRMLNRVRPYARVIAPRGSLRFKAIQACGKTGLGVMRMGSRGIRRVIGSRRK